ncbi:MAG: VOC family protein [Phenylobacterium sp.]|uniref:VOC family protein n=1 Tax=Phenylobacterium sp. TaxID=1871053 RepID=UPI00391CA030
MFDHVGFIVSDVAAARRLYEAALAPLGLKVIEDQDDAFILAGAENPIPFVYVGGGRPTYWREGARAGASPAHFAFSAPDRAAVDAFHAAGLAAGGRDNGAPGPRGGGYYAAFLLDGDDNNLEAGVREA